MFDGQDLDSVRTEAFDNRGKVSQPGKTLKNHERNQARIKNYGNELVRFVILDDKREPRPHCSWRIPRRKLQYPDLAMDLLYDIISHSPMEIPIIEYFEEIHNGTVVFPKNMFHGLEKVPAAYNIVPRPTRVPDDRGHDPHYEGDVYVFLMEVPMMTDNNAYPVQTCDLEAYLRFGIAEEDTQVRAAARKIREMQRDVDKFDKKIRNVGYETLVGPDNKLIEDVIEQEKERQSRYEHYQSEKNRLTILREAEEANLEKLKRRFDIEDITFDLIDSDDEAQICNYKVNIDGPQALRLFDILMKKNDWEGIQMAIKSHYADTWIGREPVPDGTKHHETDLKAFEVNIRNMRLIRMQHGFGTWLETEPQVDGHDFSFYHGQWKFGERHGYGVEYTNSGIYSGPFNKNAKMGVARMDYANGDIFQGEFACIDRLGRKSETNPYYVGNPEGQVTITFADGGFYEGHMDNGVPNGEGRYLTSQGDEYEGTWLRGRLHGSGRVRLVHGETFEGHFRQGKLEGYAHWHNKYGDTYEGFWRRGLRFGRGLQVYRNNDQYRGFFVNDTRTGRGVMHMGHTHTTAHPNAQDVEILVSDMRHEGKWAADEIEPRGMITTYPAENTWYTAQECRNTFPYALQLKKEDWVWKRRLRKRRDRILQQERCLRQELLHRKRKIFEHQLGSARELAELYQAGEIDTDALRAAFVAREHRINSYIDLHDLEGDELDEFWEKMRTDIGYAADTVDDVAEQTRQDSQRTLLASLIQSSFEEMEERHKLLNLPKIMNQALAEANMLIKQAEAPKLSAAEQSSLRLKGDRAQQRLMVMYKGSGGKQLKRVNEQLEYEDTLATGSASRPGTAS